MKEIELKGINGIGKVALVDDEDYEYLNQTEWKGRKSGHDTYYAIGKGRGGLLMHRMIMNVNNQFDYVDHIDGNGLNNQKSNLRICTPLQNSQNRKPHVKSTSKYLGVHIEKFKMKNGIKKCYRAQIQINGISKHIGLFPLTIEGEIAAAKAYDQFAIEHHKEFANPNFK